MQNRTAYLLIGVLGICCLGLLFSVVYPVAFAEPLADRPADEQFAVGDAEQYSRSGQVVVDGELQVGFEEAQTASGERYQRIEFSNSRTERYQPDSNASIYIRHTMDAEASVDTMREQITTDDAQELRQENRSDGRVTFTSIKNSSDPSAEFQAPEAVVVQSFQLVAYKQADDSTGRTVDFTPQTGWYGGSEGYRVTNATGNVQVDAETYEIESASVSWDVTAPAGSYAEYVLHSLGSHASTTHEIVFDVREDNPELSQPTWVANTQDNNQTTRSLSGF